VIPDWGFALPHTFSRKRTTTGETSTVSKAPNVGQLETFGRMSAGVESQKTAKSVHQASILPVKDFHRFSNFSGPWFLTAF
jgi:hypothetical protein